MPPEVSVVIPVKNEAHKIGACLDAILSQSVKPKEIVVIDSGSTDGTVDVVKKYKEVQLIEILPTDFNHGLTRNFGVNNTTGEYVLFTVQDARATDTDWIKKMLEGFNDKKVVAVGGKQVVPHEADKNPVEWYRPVNKGKIAYYSFSPKEFEALSPIQKKDVCGLDNVSAMYRRSALFGLPFRDSMEAEDAMWAKDAYRKGYTIAFNPEATVYHYHHEKMDYVFRRTLLVLYFRYKEFGYIYPHPKKSIIDILRDIKLIVTAESVGFGKKIYWLNYNRQLFLTIQKAHREFSDALAFGEEKLYERCKELIKKGLMRV